MSEYIFVVCEVDGQVFAMVAEENDFRNNGGISDQHISQACGGNMPDILGWDEEAESFFMPWNDVVMPSDAHDDLLSKGLKFGAAFADWAENNTDGTVYRPQS